MTPGSWPEGLSFSRLPCCPQSAPQKVLAENAKQLKESDIVVVDADGAVITE